MIHGDRVVVVVVVVNNVLVSNFSVSLYFSYSLLFSDLKQNTDWPGTSSMTKITYLMSQSISRIEQI